MDKNQIAENIAAEIESLPPVPATIIELRRVMADRDADFSQVVPLLKKDPGLCADLLKFVNSARYGVGHKVQTVEEAVLYFGMRNLSHLVSSVFADRVVMSHFGKLKGIERYIEHSCEISTASEMLAAESAGHLFDRQACSLAGLIHDIGRLVLTAAVDSSLVVSMTGEVEGFRSIIDNEQDLFGVDHCLIGSRICDKWGFPGFFVNAIRFHHSRPTADLFCPEALLVFLAHIASIDGMSDAAYEGALPPAVWNKLGLNAGALLRVNRNMTAGGEQER